MSALAAGVPARLRDLPLNARFHLDGDPSREYIVSTPYDAHEHGFVDVISVGEASSGGFFDNPDQQVHVTWLPEVAR